MKAGRKRYILAALAVCLVFLINLNSVLAQEAPDISAAVPTINSFQLTGAAVSSVPVLVPPGRNGIAPKLTLDYNSFRKNGWVGVGWDLDMGAIHRSTKRGVCYECNDYVVSMNGSSSELVPRTDWGPNYYGAKIEGAFTKYRFNGSNGWEATTKDGTTYYYGQDPKSRQDNPHNSAKVFKWCLDKVKDSNGNYMAIEYEKNPDGPGTYKGQVYLKRVIYTGNISTGLEANNTVEFYLEGRNDVTSMYTANFAVSTTKRLRAIEVYGNGQLSRRYELNYGSYSPNTFRSLLRSVVQYGSDGQGRFPETQFFYQTGEDGFEDKGAWVTGAYGGWDHAAERIRSMDVNGDGMHDVVIGPDGNGAWYVLQSTGSGFENKGAWITGAYGGWDHAASRIRPMDVNGDGLEDIVIGPDGNGAWYVLQSTGSSFVNKGAWVTGAYGGWDHAAERIRSMDVNGDGLEDIVIGPDGNGAWYVLQSTGSSFVNKGAWVTGAYGGWDHAAERIRSMDVNGDGLEDIVIGPDGNGAWYVLQSTGSSFVNKGAWVTGAYGGWDHAAERIRPMDVNGDGLEDIVIGPGGSGAWFVLQSTGSSFVDRGAWINGAYGGWDGAASRIRPMDVNGDGLQDIVIGPGGSGAWFVLQSTGSSFVDRGAWINGAYGGWDGAASRIRPMDVNGDGLQDLVVGPNDSGNWYVIQSQGPTPDLLNSVENGLGGTTASEYTASSRYQNHRLPYIVHPVSSITVDDGIQKTAVTTITYDYSGGLFDFATREFRGFKTVTQTNPDGTILKTTFYQGDPIDPADNFFFKSRQKWVELREPNEGPLLTKTDFIWETYPASPSRDSWAFVKLTHKITESYDSETVTAQENYLYDDTNGNLISMTTSGPEAESITTSFLYEKFGGWLWRKTRETVEGSVSGMVRESYYEYEPGTGNLLYKEFWLDTGSNPRIAMTYDDYGNQQMVTDARGNITVTEYDSATHTYPIKITYPQTNGVSHVVENEEWDYRFGKPTVTKDENGNRTYYYYDEFGRLDQVDSPDGGQVITEYFDDVFPRFVLTKAKEDSSGTTIDAYEYFDGLGRSIQTISFGENGQPIVTQTRYDAMGRADQTWGPFFRNYTVHYRAEDIPINIPYAKTDYDLRGRPVRIESPLGEDVDTATRAVTTFSYSGLATTVTDPDGGKKTEIKDYLGRIVQVTEYSDAGELYTDYRYNAAGDLLDVTDAMGNVTAMSYDSLGRKIRMSDPDMDPDPDTEAGDWQYTYDANGNLDTQTDGKGNQIKFRYDAINRVDQKEYLDTGDPKVDYVYDLGINGIGRLYSVSNGEGTTVYDEYDPIGREKSVTRQIRGAPLSAYTTHYSYDYAGKVKSMVYPGTTPYQVNYDYHPGSGLLHTVTGISDFTEYAELTGYEPTGKIGDIYHGNGTETLYTYDPKSTRLLSIQTTDPYIAPLLHKFYKYTPAGNIKTITRVSNAQRITYSYAYDKLHRLIGETNTGGSDDFDPSMLTKTYDDTAPIHAVKSVILNRVDYPYSYDENGNMTVGWDFTNPSVPVERQIDFNADNMPVQVRHMRSSGTVKIDLSYDGAGVRVRKAVQGGITTYYIGDHYEVKNGVATKFIFAGNLRVASITGTDINYFHKDHLGSSLVITDKNGNVLETAEYTPFGGLRNHTGPTVSDYKFTDQEYDQSSGLYNYNARLYDPNIGTFISPDPFVQAPFDPQTLNRYTYVRNNPLIYVDPSGYGWLSKAWKKVKKAAKKVAKAVVSVVTTEVLTHILLSPFDIMVPGLGQVIAIGIGYASNKFADYSVDKVWGSNGGGGGGGSISSGIASSGSSGGGHSGRYFPSGVSPGGGYAAISGANHDFANAYSANVVSNGYVFHGEFYQAIGKIYNGVKWGKFFAGFGVFAAGGATAIGGVVLTGALLTGEHALAVPTAGASLLLTVHSVTLGGTIIATGGTIAKIGVHMMWDALKSESSMPKNHNH